MRRFLFEYPFDGDLYALEIVAADEAEASARIKAVPWAKYKGEVSAVIPVPTSPRSFWKWLRGYTQS